MPPCFDVHLQCAAKENTNYRNEENIPRAGKKIRETRLSKQMTIEQPAIECDVDTTQISRMEPGKVNFTISHLNSTHHFKTNGGLRSMHLGQVTAQAFLLK